MTAFEAEDAGTLAEANMAKMGITWVTFEGRRERGPSRADPASNSHRLIVEATREKVRQNDNVRKVLLATGDLMLKPDHIQEADAPAAWRYYQILTMIRGELQRRGKP